MSNPNEGDLRRRQIYARTGKAPGYSTGGSVGGNMAKHEHGVHGGGAHHDHSEHGVHKGHGRHGHKPPHEHHTEPGAGHSGHGGTSIRSLVKGGHQVPMHEMHAHDHGVDTDGGGGHHNSRGVEHSGTSTGATRNRI